MSSLQLHGSGNSRYSQHQAVLAARQESRPYVRVIQQCIGELVGDGNFFAVSVLEGLAHKTFTLTAVVGPCGIHIVYSVVDAITNLSDCAFSSMVLSSIMGGAWSPKPKIDNSSPVLGTFGKACDLSLY